MIMNFETVWFCDEAIAADSQAHAGIHLETVKKNCCTPQSQQMVTWPRIEPDVCHM